MTPPVYGLLATLCVALAVYAAPRTRAAEIDPFDRVADAGDAADKSLLRRLFRHLTQRLGPAMLSTRGKDGIAKLDTLLDYAGRPGGMTAQNFLGRQAATMTMLGGAFLFLALLGSSPFLVFVGVLGGWALSEIWLRRTARLRQERIERDLPDFLDILSVTVGAGLGYRSALQRVAEALGGPVGDEMTLALRQMGLGVSRREAFEGLRARSDAPSMASFVAAQLQAEELGVPLADALTDIAADTRRIAHQNARRHAQRAAPRVSLITTMLILPGVMILLIVSIVVASGIQDSGLFG